MATITKEDVIRIKALSQNAIDEVWDNASPDEKRSFAYCGFAWVKFKGVKIKNLLEKAGLEVSKNSEGGYSLSVYQFYNSTPAYADNEYERNACYGQSMTLKEVVGETVSKELKLLGIDCWVDSRSD